MACSVLVMVVAMVVDCGGVCMWWTGESMDDDE